MTLVRSALSSMVAGAIRGKQAGQEPLGSAAPCHGVATDLPGSFDGSAVRADKVLAELTEALKRAKEKAA